jgi:hypothetical protein
VRIVRGIERWLAAAEFGAMLARFSVRTLVGVGEGPGFGGAWRAGKLLSTGHGSTLRDNCKDNINGSSIRMALRNWVR